MIPDVDEALRALLVREALRGSGDVEVSFDAPSTEWASRRSGPAVNVYLYDIREDVARRQTVYERVHDDAGIVTGVRQPGRRFRLAYLLTAWTQRPEDEHRLLASCLGCLLRHETLPADLLGGALAGANNLVTVGLPDHTERATSEIWTALGGELKPSLEVHVNAPFDVDRVRAVGPPVLQEPGVVLTGPGGARERPRRQARAAEAAVLRRPASSRPLVERLRGDGEEAARAAREDTHGSGALVADGTAPQAPGRWFRTAGPPS